MVGDKVYYGFFGEYRSLTPKIMLLRMIDLDGGQILQHGGDEGSRRW